ncbi:SRPBCC family protein [Rhodococcus sp. D2-41]|uniref:SRPBCC family protein n=1 Tax=Speluncibacter jeojiensis TaxID=2710754 RepID=A0A9X4LW27_9ACTN|nr:SRPBCC family protein [Rhodococcus sp. D2-41]MDG3011956.1 SRPBCC family protein [Rhodococcus sp. D2-41]MDG3013408.1 SRPBCC family protein [Corynebacteriales bacterium D3-21]
MAEKTSGSIVIDASAARVMDVIADFASYPTWVTAAKTVEVLATAANGRAEQVRFVLDAGIVKDTYVLAYDWSVDGLRVSWNLVSAQMQKAQSGSYTLHERAGATEVTYELTIDVTIPMIGMFKRKAEKTIVNTALNELKKQVEG